MENLYKSLYSDIFYDDDTHSPIFDHNIINTISGQTDICSLSRYYSINEYISEVNTTGDK